VIFSGAHSPLGWNEYDKPNQTPYLCNDKLYLIPSYFGIRVGDYVASSSLEYKMVYAPSGGGC